MFYRKYNASLALQPFIFCYYILEHNEFLHHSIDVVSPPNGLTGMVINYGDPYKVSNEDKDNCFYKVPFSFVAGQFTKNYTLRFHRNVGMIGVVFQPAGLAHILGMPTTTFTNQRIDLNLVMGKEVAKLENAILECKNHLQRIAIIEKFLLKKLNQTKNKIDVVDKAVDLIFHNKGLLSIAKLSDDLCISPRQLHRRFLEKIGISPKLFSRIKRFNYISLLTTNSSADWKDIVYEGGYYDQAHFIKDISDFSGKNPSDFVQYKRKLNSLIGA